MYLDSDNRPTAEFFPTKMQPALSAAVLPLCMRIPSKWGTFNNLGRLRPNLGDQFVGHQASPGTHRKRYCSEDAVTSSIGKGPYSERQGFH